MNASLVSEPKYLHACTALHGTLIDETDIAFHRCRCFQPSPELLAIQDAHAVELDRMRSEQS